MADLAEEDVPLAEAAAVSVVEAVPRRDAVSVAEAAPPAADSAEEAEKNNSFTR